MDNITNRVIESARPWFLDHGFKVLVILLITLILRKFIGIFIESAIRKLIIPDSFASTEAEKKREDTLIKIFNGTVNVIILIVAILMVLQEFGVAVGPVLAAAGVAGLALGFGGQYFIKDIISGMFIILENQYRIGDVVCFGESCGAVEDITLRMTTLRDLDGNVHHIPHGEVTKTTNLSKGFSRINLNIGISYNADLEKVIDIINKVGNEMTNDDDWKVFILKAPQFLRVDDFADSAMILKILGDTAPLKQWDVAGEFRKRLKIAFDREGVEIPFPQIVIHKAKK